MPFVYSTSTNNTDYVEYGASPPGGRPPVIRRVTVNGRANVPDSAKTLYTPSSVGTEISQEDADWLSQHEAFERHVKAGFMILSKAKTAPAKVAAGMKAKDGSAPKTPADFETAPKTGAIA